MKPLRYAIYPAILAVAVGCATFPPPTQRLANAEAAQRGAQEVGAANQPEARLHAQLAAEQIAKARVLMKDNDDNKAADLMLMRAEADADVAIALAREQRAKAELAQAVDKANAMRAVTGTPEAPSGAQP